MVNKDVQSLNSNYGSHLTPTTHTFRATKQLKDSLQNLKQSKNLLHKKPKRDKDPSNTASYVTGCKIQS